MALTEGEQAIVNELKAIKKYIKNTYVDKNKAEAE
jgi:hypothetical protein